MGLALRAEPDHVSGLLDDFILCRVAGGDGVTRSQVLRDLGAFVSQRLSPCQIRQHVEAALAKSRAAGLIKEHRGRVNLTPAGRFRVCDFLGCKSLPVDWQTIRDVRLVAYGLGLAGESQQRINSLARPDGLRAAILQQAYGLPGKRPPSAARLRCALAGVALERAFGNKIKGGLESGKGLSAKAGRLLAAQLARRPREFGTDARLIAALAAEACAASQGDAASLRTAILKNAITHSLKQSPPLSEVSPESVPQQAHSAPAPQVGTISIDTNTIAARPITANSPAIRSIESSRPDLSGFAAIVRAIAERNGDGWSGSKKVFICVVWREIQAAYKDWGLSEIEFKAMLVEAHRTGHLILANADLRVKKNAHELQASAVSYKNTVWHYVRAEI